MYLFGVRKVSFRGTRYKVQGLGYRVQGTGYWNTGNDSFWSTYLFVRIGVQGTKIQGTGVSFSGVPETNPYPKRVLGYKVSIFLVYCILLLFFFFLNKKKNNKKSYKEGIQKYLFFIWFSTNNKILWVERDSNPRPIG